VEYFKIKVKDLPDTLFRTIPGYIWERFFTKDMSRDGVYFIKIPKVFFDSLRYDLNVKSYAATAGDIMQHEKALDPEYKHQWWLAAAYLYPDISDEVLLSYTEKLNLLPNEKLICIAALGKASLFDKLVETEPSTYLNLMKSNKDSVCITAAMCGNTRFFEYLAEKAPNDLVDILKKYKVELDFYEPKHTVFSTAAKYGQQEVVAFLLDFASKQHGHDLVQDIICPDGRYRPFIHAAKNGHYHIVKYFMNYFPREKVEEMVCSADYGAFRQAIAQGHEGIAYVLLGYVLEEHGADMIQASNYGAFTSAARLGLFQFMDKLIALQKLIDPSKVETMLSASEVLFFGNEGPYSAFSCIARYARKYPQNQDAQSMLLKFCAYPSPFQYIESHDETYGESCTHAFVDTKIEELKANPVELDEQQAKLCFYLLRNLIRRGDASRIEDARFLMSIPAVKDLLPMEVTPNEPNELLRLAMNQETSDNQPFTRLLMDVETVRAVAQANDFYRHERREGIDLRQLAASAESSMQDLNPRERKQLQDVEKHYQPVLNKSKALADLKATMESNYEKNPASIELNGRSIALPFKWQAWQELRDTLTGEQQKQALEAYYQHKDHTAFRYLLRPNPWINPKASFVQSCAGGYMSHSREYEPLIALLYTAANDALTPPTKGYSVEDRIQGLINELAYCGRAHNWDGKQLIKRNGKEAYEDYDDLLPDNPSCIDGVKRRLFQSVQGHPLLDFLTIEIINQEITEFARAHFKAFLEQHPDKIQGLKEAWDLIFEEGKETDILKLLDIPEKAQNEFLERFAQKYGNQFTDDPSFATEIRNRFSTEGTMFASHAARFGGEADLLGLLEKVKEPLSKDAIQRLQDDEDPEETNEFKHGA